MLNLLCLPVSPGVAPTDFANVMLSFYLCLFRNKTYECIDFGTELGRLGTPVGCIVSGHAAGPELLAPNPVARLVRIALGPADASALRNPTIQTPQVKNDIINCPAAWFRQNSEAVAWWQACVDRQVAQTCLEWSTGPKGNRYPQA